MIKLLLLSKGASFGKFLLSGGMMLPGLVIFLATMYYELHQELPRGY